MNDNPGKMHITFRGVELKSGAPCQFEIKRNFFKKWYYRSLFAILYAFKGESK